MALKPTSCGATVGGGRQWIAALYLAVALLSLSDRSTCNAFVTPRAQTPLPSLLPSSSSSSLKLYIDHDAASGTAGPTSVITKRSSSRRRMSSEKDYLHKANSADELDHAVQSETDKLVVVRFHAPYCKACQAIKVAYERIASSNPQVKFIDVSINDQEDYPNHQVPATPYAHIYHPDHGLVEHSPIARQRLSAFKKALNWWKDGQADLPEEFHTDPNYQWDHAKLSWSNPLAL